MFFMDHSVLMQVCRFVTVHLLTVCRCSWYQSLLSTCNPIINKPKPKPKEEPPKDGLKPDDTAAANGPSAEQPDDAAAKSEQKEPQVDADDAKADMELD